MSAPAVQRNHFRVDTSRPRSRSKLRAKMRQVLGVMSGMFPLMALFIYLMSWFRLPVERKNSYLLAVIFLACGMVTLLFFAWARSEKMRRHEISARNRELRHRELEESLLLEKAPASLPAAGTNPKEG